MSGRPDPAAGWGATEEMAADGDTGRGDARDTGDSGDAETTTDAAAGASAAGDDDGRERVTQPRGRRGGAGAPGGRTAGSSGARASGASEIRTPGAAEGAAGGAPEAASHGAANGAGAEDGAGTILADVAALTAERDDYLQSLQRLKADFDNYRKRVARLQEEQTARAAAGLVEKLLPVIDNLDLALAHLVQEEPATEDARALAQARTQLLDVLSKEGLERVDATEVPFDPTVHDAVAHTAVEPKPAKSAAGAVGAAEAEGEAANAPNAPNAPGAPEAGGSGSAAGATPQAGGHEVVVDGVLRAGYRWRGQVLRPAMVRVRG